MLIKLLIVVVSSQIVTAAAAQWCQFPTAAALALHFAVRKIKDILRSSGKLNIFLNKYEFLSWCGSKNVERFTILRVILAQGPC